VTPTKYWSAPPAHPSLSNPTYVVAHRVGAGIVRARQRFDFWRHASGQRTANRKSHRCSLRQLMRLWLSSRYGVPGDTIHHPRSDRARSMVRRHSPYRPRNERERGHRITQRRRIAGSHLDRPLAEKTLQAKSKIKPTRRGALTALGGVGRQCSGSQECVPPRLGVLAGLFLRPTKKEATKLLVA
jgi:hypothetical protein